jgi:hypothetical protein
MMPLRIFRRSAKALQTDGRAFPYYAGFPEAFCANQLLSAELWRGAVILDP